MKKSVMILMIVLILIAIAIGIYLYSSEKVYKLSEEEKLTAGGNEPGELREISIETTEEIFEEVSNAVDEHLSG